MDWTDLYLRTETADELREACPWLFFIDEFGVQQWIASTDSWALDVIGPVVRQPPVFDRNGQVTTAAVIDGRFHANLRCTADVAKRVPASIAMNPDTPGRTFAGLPPKSGPAKETAEWIAVNAERDRRLAAGMTFADHVFQSDDASRERIDRSRISAMAAIMGGAQKGDLRWHGLPVDFFWIAADDTRMPMDAQTMVAFGNAMAAREGLLIVAGNDLKQRIAAGETIADIGSDALWPAA